MGVSKNTGTPKWMVIFHGSKPCEQMDDLGGFPIFLETPIYTTQSHHGPKLRLPTKFQG